MGFDSFIVPDSICYPAESDATYPYNGDGTREFLDGRPFIEPFSLIPALAAVTEKIRFTTFVVKLPIRHPVLVTKQVMSVGVLTGNRFGFGVGTSPWPEDYAVTDTEWRKRGARMDEMMEIINALQSGDCYEHTGDHYEFQAIKMTPAPTERVPLLVGGHSKMALERAGRIGDGWMHGVAMPSLSVSQPMLRWNTVMASPLRAENADRDQQHARPMSTLDPSRSRLDFPVPHHGPPCRSAPGPERGVWMRKHSGDPWVVAEPFRMRDSFDSHSYRRYLAAVFCVCIGLAGCATNDPVASETTGVQGKDVSEENARIANTSEASPASVPYVDEASELTSELPRTTAAGIRIATDFEQVDFNDGNGTVNSISYRGTRGSDSVGAFLDTAFAATPVDRTESEVWVSSAGILLMVFHAGPGVTEMVLESSGGDIDRAAPGTDGVIVVAVPGSNPDQIEARAFDGDGNVLATCIPDELGFLGCS